MRPSRVMFLTSLCAACASSVTLLRTNSRFFSAAPGAAPAGSTCRRTSVPALPRINCTTSSRRQPMTSTTAPSWLCETPVIRSLATRVPAAAAGTLVANDRITGVSQSHDGAVVDVIGWRLDDVVQLIRGKAGTLVRLQVLPAGAAPGAAEKNLEFVRNRVTLEAQAAHKEVKNITRDGRMLKVGVVTVPGFYQDIAAQTSGDENYRSTTRDVRRLLGELKAEHVDGLVLDLRNNGGGYLPEATALTGLFIKHGPVVQLGDTTC